MQTAFRCPRLSTAFAGLPAYRRCNYRARSTLTHASGMELAGFSRWLERCNRQSDQELVPFTIDGSVLGYVTPTLLTRLAALDAFRATDTGVTCAPHLVDEPSRTAAVASALAQLRADGLFSGWRDELYPVSATFGGEPLLLIERAAAAAFGIKAYGVHINGFVRRPDGLHLWVARRSLSKPTWPGKLDHLAAGGQPHGIGLHANVVKECGEEAGVDPELATSAKACGAVSYQTFQDSGGLKREVLFVFDLELPETFRPKAEDGEVQDFRLLPVEQVMSLVRDTDEFKDNCNLVLLDFFVRHGLMEADAPGYLQLVRGLRAGDCS